MFGYVVVNKPEMKFREFEVYRSFYCGLCRELRERYGIPGQISLTYDMTFVLMLLSSLYEPPTQKGTTNCVVHPFVKQVVRRNAITEYAADMNILLTYYKCADDWADDRNFVKRGYGAVLSGSMNDLIRKYPRQAKEIREGLERLGRMERSGETQIDKVAGCFGEMLGSIMVYREDVWKPTLQKVGFYLGKFIYILDAFEDVEKDRKEKNYNPFLFASQKENFEQMIEQLLMMMAAECGRQYERLPLLRYREILGNILYSGIWCKYYAVREKRQKEQEKSNV